MELLKTQKNEVFEILKSNNLPLSDFKWMPFSSLKYNMISHLIYKEGEFYFFFNLYNDNFDFEYSPGMGKRNVKGSFSSWKSVQAVKLTVVLSSRNSP